jgi:hypothetical protein
MGRDTVLTLAWVDLGELDAEGLERTTTYSRALTTIATASIDSVAEQLEAHHELILLREDGGSGTITGIVTRRQLMDFLRPAADAAFFDPMREAPVLNWCSEGMHYTEVCPCFDHPGSKCG